MLLSNSLVMAPVSHVQRLLSTTSKASHAGIVETTVHHAAIHKTVLSAKRLSFLILMEDVVADKKVESILKHKDVHTALRVLNSTKITNVSKFKPNYHFHARQDSFITVKLISVNHA